MVIGFLKRLLALAAALLLAAVARAEVPEKIKFNQHVRPILSGNCFYCQDPTRSIARPTCG